MAMRRAPKKWALHVLGVIRELYLRSAAEDQRERWKNTADKIQKEYEPQHASG